MNLAAAHARNSRIMIAARAATAEAVFGLLDRAERRQLARLLDRVGAGGA